ncbi:zf-HC2 domain-containing protein [bacterium]|nr:zf-HC2 domain-containing protein [bacterium]
MQNNECVFICEQFTEYRENTLSIELKSQVDTHLAACSSCAKVFQELGLVLDKLKQLPTLSTTQEFTNILMARIQHLDQESVLHRMYNSSYTRVAGYAIAAGLIVAIGLNIWIDPVSLSNPDRSPGYAVQQQSNQIPQSKSFAGQIDSSSDKTEDSLKIQYKSIDSGSQKLQLVNDSE